MAVNNLIVILPCISRFNTQFSTYLKACVSSRYLGPFFVKNGNAVSLLLPFRAHLPQFQARLFAYERTTENDRFNRGCRNAREKYKVDSIMYESK